MKRPRTALRVFLLFCLGLVSLEYFALTRLAPRYVTQLVERAADSKLFISSTQLSFPLTTTFRGLWLMHNTDEAGLGVPRIVVRPRWVSLPSRTVWIDAVDVSRPFLRLKRRANGSIVWPSLDELMAQSGLEPLAATRAGWPSSWRVHINSVRVDEAAIEFTDVKPRSPFRGVVHHLSIVMGPVTMPVSAPVIFAIRGSFTGHEGHDALFYCSGSWDATAKDLEASCRMEPIALAAFLPYVTGRKAQMRTYAMTVGATGRWLARANELQASIQLALGQLREGDVSVHGQTIVDVQQMTGGQPQSTLRGEVQVSGPLDDPARWRAQFYPGDEPVRLLVERLLEHEVKAIRLPLLGGARIRLVPATKESIQDIESASREVVEALDILASPEPEPVPPSETPAAAPEAVPETEPAASPVEVPAAPEAPMIPSAPAAPPPAP